VSVHGAKIFTGQLRRKNEEKEAMNFFLFRKKKYPLEHVTKCNSILRDKMVQFLTSYPPITLPFNQCIVYWPPDVPRYLNTILYCTLSLNFVIM